MVKSLRLSGLYLALAVVFVLGIGGETVYARGGIDAAPYFEWGG